MSYKTEFQSNNADLQAILDAVNNLPDVGGESTSTFVPTDSGGTGYKTKVADNNVDLQRILDLINTLPDKIVVPVAISGAGMSRVASIVINGTHYSSQTDGLSVSPGDVVTLWVGGISASLYGQITIDGSVVLTTDDYGSFTYDWTIPSGTTSISVVLSYTYVESIYDDYYGRITITTA